MTQVTLKKLANKLNISVTTVSKALKGYSDVSKTTRDKVFKLAKELDYTPNSVAVNLRTQETKIVGVIIPTIVHHFFSKVIDGIIDEAEKEGYLVITLQSNESVKSEKRLIDVLINKKVDGILLSLANDHKSSKHLKKIINHRIPLVLFDKISKRLQCSKVIIDDVEAAYKAVTHLLQIGCKKIAHFRGPLNPQNSVDRFLGYKKALEEHHIKYEESLIYTCEEVSFEEGYNFAKKMYEEHRNIDAIFAVTDLVAIGAIAYLNDRNIKIPDQISVVGFSNWFMSSVANPTLTTIHQPAFDMGKKAAKLLFGEINAQKNEQKFAPKTMVLPTKLIQRESTFSI